MKVNRAAGPRLVQLAERYVSAWNDHDLDALVDLWTRDGVMVSPTLGEVRGHDQLRATLAAALDAFPDVRLTLHDVMISQRQAALEITETGTFLRALTAGATTLGANGRSFEQRQIHLLRFAGDRIQHRSAYYDRLEWYRQLGLGVE